MTARQQHPPDCCPYCKKPMIWNEWKEVWICREHGRFDTSEAVDATISSSTAAGPVIPDFANAKIGDWIEDVGDITTFYEQAFIRRFGQALSEARQQAAAEAKAEVLDAAIAAIERQYKAADGTRSKGLALAIDVLEFLRGEQEQAGER